jgi:HME family heavy-metal exporter
LFQPLGVAYIVSILASFVTAITLTPVLCSYLLPEVAAKRGEKESGLVRRLKAGNLVCSTGAFSHEADPWRQHRGQHRRDPRRDRLAPRLFASFNEGSFVVNLLLEPGVSLEQSAELGGDCREACAQHPRKSLASAAALGRAELDEHAEGRPL